MCERFVVMFFKHIMYALDRTQKIFIGSLDAAYPSYTTKKFLASMEDTEAGEAAEAENFPKKSMAQNA